MKDEIQTLILSEIPDAICIFEGDACNLTLKVQSKLFKDISLISQHKMILKVLSKKFESGDLHALSIETEAI